MKTYRKHASRLHQTGEGVEGSQQNEQFDYYISPEGPNESTPAIAVNIWRNYYFNTCLTCF